MKLPTVCLTIDTAALDYSLLYYHLLAGLHLSRVSCSLVWANKDRLCIKIQQFSQLCGQKKPLCHPPGNQSGFSLQIRKINKLGPNFDASFLRPHALDLVVAETTKAPNVYKIWGAKCGEKDSYFDCNAEKAETFLLVCFKSIWEQSWKKFCYIFVQQKAVRRKSPMGTFYMMKHHNNKKDIHLSSKKTCSMESKINALFLMQGRSFIGVETKFDVCHQSSSSLFSFPATYYAQEPFWILGAAFIFFFCTRAESFLREKELCNCAKCIDRRHFSESF